MKVRYIIVVIAAIILASCAKERQPLQIIVTNDSHSQVEPLNGMGGYEACAHIIDSLKTENPNTILLDAGDMFQGSPYFNMYKGKLEIEAYNLMGYDAVTLGNHEFDNGIEILAQRISEMKFPVVCANYDFENTPLAEAIKPYIIIEKTGWKIGVIGVGVNPESLILQANIEGVKYNDPIEAVNRYAKQLRNKEKCNLVVVISHLGLHDEMTDNVTDDILAANIDDVDMILGGHTHSLHGVYKYPDLSGDSITVLQEQKSGLKLYTITVE